jgi:EpsI family protein
MGQYHYKRPVVIVIIMLMTMILLFFVRQSERIKPNKPFDTFPMKIGEWQGIPDKFDARIYDVLGVDDSVLANYRSEKKGSVNLYVGFYQSQKEGDLIHSPKNCLPGAGWNITETSIESIDVSDKKENKTIDVIRLRLEKESQKQVVLYWFQSQGRIISSEYMQKIWLVIDSITKHRTDGSFVRLISPVMGDESQTLERMKEFAKEIFPYLTEYIPS